MSVKKCAREECGKTVYPIEELKCLDKVWHKQCFKCTVCGMTLSMKNYKGYEKKPYCEPHYPKTVASVVADTPEMRRLAENTKFQSQVKYHADYEKMKGTRINVVDDPELTRHLQNSRIQSQVQYHGDLEKKKLQDNNRPKDELLNEVQPSIVEFSNENNPPLLYSSDCYKNPSTTLIKNSSSESLCSNQQSFSNSMSLSCYCSKSDSPYSQRLASQMGTIVYSSDFGGKVTVQERPIGSIADYDPLNGNWGKGHQKKVKENASFVFETQKNKGFKKSDTLLKTSNKGFTVKALYDYTAADTDEVSFFENDVIVNCEKVDEGWMTGTVQRTLTWGMLPANYVERVNQPTGLFKLQ